jgi:hypothetical protein
MVFIVIINAEKTNNRKLYISRKDIAFVPQFCPEGTGWGYRKWGKYVNCTKNRRYRTIAAVYPAGCLGAGV